VADLEEVIVRPAPYSPAANPVSPPSRPILDLGSDFDEAEFAAVAAQCAAGDEGACQTLAVLQQFREQEAFVAPYTVPEVVIRPPPVTAPPVEFPLGVLGIAGGIAAGLGYLVFGLGDDAATEAALARLQQSQPAPDPEPEVMPEPEPLEEVLVLRERFFEVDTATRPAPMPIPPAFFPFFADPFFPEPLPLPDYSQPAEPFFRPVELAPAPFEAPPAAVPSPWLPWFQPPEVAPFEPEPFPEPQPDFRPPTAPSRPLSPPEVLPTPTERPYAPPTREVEPFRPTFPDFRPDEPFIDVRPFQPTPTVFPLIPFAQPQPDWLTDPWTSPQTQPQPRPEPVRTPAPAPPRVVPRAPADPFRPLPLAPFALPETRPQQPAGRLDLPRIPALDWTPDALPQLQPEFRPPARRVEAKECEEEREEKRACERGYYSADREGKLKFKRWGVSKTCRQSKSK